MKRLLTISLFVLASTLGFAQYNHVEFAPNGTKIQEGQYNANPGVLPTDSKEVIAQKMALVHKTGTWKYWFENGQQLAEQHYTSTGGTTGTWKTWTIGGQLESEVNYTAGTAVYYHPNGAKAEEGTITANNQRTGTWKGYHENGKLNYSGTWVAAGKNGTWTYYDNNGNVSGTEVWHNGVMSSH
jgi:antitoxin component YwqK of YwqJK toxin-antitoxin module